MIDFKLKNFFVDVTGQSLKNINDEQSAIVLPKQMMDVLVYLVQNNRTPITSEEIKAAVFKHRQIDIIEIERIMSLLADTFGTGQQILQSLGHSTYMLTADATDEHGQLPTTTRPAQFHHDPGLSRKKGFTLILVSITVIIGLSLAIVYSLSKPSISPNRTVQNSTSLQPIVAVLPFSNELANDPIDPIIDGISQILTQQLASVQSLRVISTDSSFAYRKTYDNAVQIGSLLGADYVLKGHFVKQETGVELEVKLLSVKTDSTLWQNNYPRAKTALVKLQNALFRDITTGLNRVLPAKIIDKTLPNISPEAFEHYLKGLVYLKRNKLPATVEAIKSLNLALEAHPDNLQFKLELITALIQHHALSPDNPNQPIDQALSLLKTLKGDKLPAKYNFLMGQLALTQQHQPKAIKHFRSALAKNANHGETLFQLGATYLQLQLYDMADKTLTKAVKLNPVSRQANRLLGLTRFYRGNWQSGAEYLTKAMTSAKANPEVELELAYWYWQYGLRNNARQWAKVVQTRSPNEAQTQLLQVLLSNSLSPSMTLKATDATTIEKLAEIYYYSGNHNELHQILDSNNLDSTQSRYWLGILKVKQAQYQAAIDILSPLSKDAGLLQPGAQLMLYNQLAFCASKLKQEKAKQHYLKQAKNIQAFDYEKGLRSPYFISEMAGYFVLSGETDKARQLLKNTSRQGWNVDAYIKNNPVLAVLR